MRCLVAHLFFLILFTCRVDAAPGDIWWDEREHTCLQSMPNPQDERLDLPVQRRIEEGR